MTFPSRAGSLSPSSDIPESYSSFYFYILDAHERDWHDAVGRQAPTVDLTLEQLVSETCEHELLPYCQREFDRVKEASDASSRTFFARYFPHELRPKSTCCRRPVVDSHGLGHRRESVATQLAEQPTRQQVLDSRRAVGSRERMLKLLAKAVV